MKSSVKLRSWYELLVSGTKLVNVCKKFKPEIIIVEVLGHF